MTSWVSDDDGSGGTLPDISRGWYYAANGQGLDWDDSGYGADYLPMGEWNADGDGSGGFLHNPEKVFAMDGVCVERCPYTGEETYPGSSNVVDTDFFGAAVSAVGSVWERTAATSTAPAQALNYINKGECIPICLTIPNSLGTDIDYYAQVGSQTCDTLEECTTANKDVSYYNKAVVDGSTGQTLW